MSKDDIGAGSGRRATVERTTNETALRVGVDLDGTGRSEIVTGIGFLDHMVEQLARHSLIDIKIEAKGDLDVDYHHTTEDTGIALGQAIAKALGQRTGIERYAAIDLAMDEALTRVAVDVSGRPYLVWSVPFTRAKIGEMDTELFREFFHALAMNAGLTLHITSLAGDNNHHIAESCFKGVARVLKSAFAIDPRAATRVPSTKGTLSV